jgi:3'-phosphoadenosine 5'-phosphosulfate sulfotransferase (PAPS reductase)/FAD synthetase
MDKNKCRKYGSDTRIDGFFIEGGDEFPEVLEFVRNVAKSYKLNVTEVKGTQKGALTALKKARPKIVAVLMGSRSTDPMGKYMKTKCEWTDADWPTFLRVILIVKWEYF